MTHVYDSWDRATDENYETYVLGDFNKNWFNQEDSALLRSYADICGLTQTVSEATRTVNTARSTTTTCLDLIFTNNPEQNMSNCKVISVGFTDHDLTVLSIKSKIPKGLSKVVYKRSYKHFSAEKFINDLKLIPFWLVESSDDPNEALDTFLNLFRDIADIHAPIRKYTVKSKPAPWLTQNIRDLMLMRDAAKREAKVSGFPSDWAVYRKLRNHVVKINRESKRAYFLEAINNTKKDPKSMWKTINNLLGRSNCPIPTYAESNGEIYTKPKDIANHFAKFFNEKINKYRFEMSNPIDTEYVTKSITEIMTGKNCRFEFSSLSLLEVHSCLDKLPDTKVTGVDGIDNFLLRIASNIIAEPIRYIFNCSYAKSIFPDQWKVAKLHPIPKDKKQPFEDINSRPISLLNVLSKLHEKFAHKQICHYVSEHNLMLKNQHAYRINHSTESALLHLTDSCLDNMENGMLTGAALLDFSAAFDLIDHNLLLLKLKCYNFSDNAINWIKSYLSGRTSTVYINGAFSNPIEMTCGVPQGSCLGPLLFSLFVNDLPTVLTTADITLYADDSTPFQSGHNARLISDKLQLDLSKVELWVAKNRLVLNADKTNSILIGSRQKIKSAPSLNLSIKDKIIEQLPCVKLLGVQVDENLSWKQHCEDLLKDCSKALGLLFKFSRYIPSKVLKIIAEALILSKLNYCCTVWGSAQNQESINNLQKLQNKAARLILGYKVDEISRENLHDEIGWLTVRQRIHVRTLMALHNVLYSGEPNAIYVNFKPFEIIHEHNTRFSSRCRSDNMLLEKPTLKKKTFLARAFRARAIRLWNNLDYTIKIISSKSMFKSAVLKQLDWFI